MYEYIRHTTVQVYPGTVLPVLIVKTEAIHFVFSVILLLINLLIDLFGVFFFICSLYLFS